MFLDACALEQGHITLANSYMGHKKMLASALAKITLSATVGEVTSRAEPSESYLLYLFTNLNDPGLSFSLDQSSLSFLLCVRTPGMWNTLPRH